MLHITVENRNVIGGDRLTCLCIYTFVYFPCSNILSPEFSSWYENGALIVMLIIIISSIFIRTQSTSNTI